MNKGFLVTLVAFFWQFLRFDTLFTLKLWYMARFIAVNLILGKSLSTLLESFDGHFL